MTHLSETEKLIDVLIEHWRFWDLHENFYLTKLAPSLVSDPSQGDDLERETLAKLRQLLTQDEWQAIPSRLAERRAGLREIESERQRRAERRTAMLHELRRRFNSDFLSATPYFFETCAGILTEQEFEAEKFSFVKSWIKANTDSRNGSKQLPDDEQIAAISSVHGHIQVVARAGSGKTTTLEGAENWIRDCLPMSYDRLPCLA